MEKTYDIFISHSSHDSQFALKVSRFLTENGLKVWIDSWNLNPGDSIAEAISKAISSSTYMIIIMSPDYFNSQWTAQEYQSALHSEIESQQIKLLPILYRKCSIPSFLQGKLYIDFTDSELHTENLDRLLKDIYRLKNTSKDQQPLKEQIAGSRTKDFDKSEVDEILENLKNLTNTFTKASVSKLDDEVDEKMCFIVMPFGNEDLNIVYEDFVKPQIEDRCGLICERGDDVFGSNVIMEDIKTSINKARVIVADLTGKNPNVFYEVGIAHTLNKPVLLLSQEMDDVPFDLRHRRVLLYEYSPRGCKKLESQIVDNVNSLLKESF